MLSIVLRHPLLFITIVSLCLGSTALSSEQSLTAKSPDGQIELLLTTNERAELIYRVSYRGEAVIADSRLGLRFSEYAHLDQGLRIVKGEHSQHSSRWEQPWGERRWVDDQHQQLTATIGTAGDDNAMAVVFRVFNDGIGFRYEVAGGEKGQAVNIVDELTEFHLPEQGVAWWIPGRRFNRYEYLYQTGPSTAIETAHSPMTLRLPTGVHLSFHEAALIDYAGYVLDQRRPNVFQTDLTPWSDGIRVKTQLPFHTPWRTIQIAPDAASLTNSDLILNLNEPNRLGDVSWVEPGKYIGIWWGMHIRTMTWGSGPIHGATNENTKRYIDFAAEHGFDGVLVEGWNEGWDGDWFHNGDVFSFTKPYPDFDLPRLSAYARSKGVRLVGHHETSGNVSNYESQLADAFMLYQKHGVRQVKTGYVADASDLKRVDQTGKAHFEWHDGQFNAAHLIRVLEAAAKHKISINTHEPIKDTGLRRTYPNWISREGARGQEFNAWGNPPNPPEHTAILPYTRMLSGPMDFTPGVFDLTFQGPDSKQRIETTLAKQLALYVVIYSPIQMAADLPKNYLPRMDVFQFIKDVPTDWEQSQALAGEVGDYFVVARQQRGGKDWYLGAVTDEAARTVSLTLDFLTPGQRYEAQIYRDGDGADWRTNPYSVAIEKTSLRHGDKLALKLAAGGGTAIRFKALD